MTDPADNDLLGRIVGPRPPAGTPDPAPYVCPDCASVAVALVEWDAHGEDHWWILLRCGECGEWREIVVSQRAAERFEIAFEDGLEDIRRDLSVLDRERMRAQAEIFAAALAHDLIGADDFRR